MSHGLRAIMKDGTTVDVCCGPAMLALEGELWGYDYLPKRPDCSNVAQCPLKRDALREAKKIKLNRMENKMTFTFWKQPGRKDFEM